MPTVQRSYKFPSTRPGNGPSAWSASSTERGGCVASCLPSARNCTDMVEDKVQPLPEKPSGIGVDIRLGDLAVMRDREMTGNPKAPSRAPQTFSRRAKGVRELARRVAQRSPPPRPGGGHARRSAAQGRRQTGPGSERCWHHEVPPPGEGHQGSEAREAAPTDPGQVRS